MKSASKLTSVRLSFWLFLGICEQNPWVLDSKSSILSFHSDSLHCPGTRTLNLAFWCETDRLETQLLVQIIINRLALLLVVRRNGVKLVILLHSQRSCHPTDNRLVPYRLKWGVAAIMTAINVSVSCVWIPARLQISDTWVNCMKLPPATLVLSSCA